MDGVTAWATAVTESDPWSGWDPAEMYISALPFGASLVAVTNRWLEPVLVDSVCRSDFGRQFFRLTRPLRVSPGRTGWVDLDALGSLPARVDQARILRKYS